MRTTPARRIGDAIHQARLRRGWQPRHLAAAIGNPRAARQMWTWENGLGIGVNSLMEVVSVLPEVGDEVVALVRQAQRRHSVKPHP